MTTRRMWLLGAMAAGGAALFGAGIGTASFRETRNAAALRIAGRSRIAATRHGRLEYAIAGDGPPLMMLHGTGGGFDQGLTFGQGLIREGFRVIAPSRFGYLGSDWVEDMTPEKQADALADLLDHLGIDRLPVAGGSAGALPAAAFALRHPDRCSHAILLVPAMNLTGADPVEFTALQRFLVGRLLTSDLWFWAALRLSPDTITGTLLATDPALVAAADPAEQLRARAIREELMPVSARWRGMLYDGRVAGSPIGFDLSGITVPTLVVSTEDDRFGTAATARLIGERVEGARVVVYPDGGHIWVGRDAEIARSIAEFTGLT